MESGIRLFLLSVALVALSGCASFRHWIDRDPPRKADTDQQPTDVLSAEAEEQEENAEQQKAPPRVVEPEVERRKIKVPKIDTENYELGGFWGALSIEDFGTQPVYGLTARYHVTQDFFFQGEVGRAYAGRTSFETLGGNIQLLTDAERRLTYYSLALGYNFLPGEVFIGRNLAMTSTFYTTLGVGSTQFAGDQHATLNLGAGFQVLPTDWLALHVGLDAHLFNSDLLGSKKLTSNLQGTIGVTVFF